MCLFGIYGVLSAAETYLSHRLPDKAGVIATPAGLLFLLLAFDWRLGLLSLVHVAFGFLIMMKMTGKDMEQPMEQYQNALSDMSNEAVEYVRGAPSGVTNEVPLNLIFYIVIMPVIGITLTKIMFMSEDAIKDLADLTNSIMGDCATLETAFSHYVPALAGSLISTTLMGGCLGSDCWIYEYILFSLHAGIL